ncbi:MAG: MBL fold metallo-hydrolase, partial [Patescibacteria group bacterium]
KFLVDCGMFQGSKYASEENLADFKFDPKEIDFLILTHAHADHCGRLPKLCKDGFGGKIYSTAATRDLAEIILLDSAKIIAEEAREHGIQALFEISDVYDAMTRFWPANYEEIVRITPEIEIRFRDAGHILGSASIECFIVEDGRQKKIVFSGDLGNPPAPIVRDPEVIDGADLVVIESTYGGKVHEPADTRVQKLRQVIVESIGQGGNLLIPVFALERSQEIIYELNYLHETRQIPKVPIFMDGPLAIEAIEIYRKYINLFDDESRERINSGDDIFNFDGLTYTRTVEQSKEINNVPSPKVILAGSGMINGGRMIHHLKRNISDANNHLLFISYQANGTMGRRLLDGANKIYINNEEFAVHAKISAIGAYSSHADQKKLIHWLSNIKKPIPNKILLDHGEQERLLGLQDGINKELKINSEIVRYGKCYEV